jgi:putative transcriptional regulator
MVRMEQTSTAGRLLISSPSMTDLNFDRTVVFMLEHTDEGAIGVVINRPSPIEVSEALPDWGGLAVDPPVVFIGGPVAQGAVIALARASSAMDTPEFAPVLGDVGVLDVSKAPADLSSTVVGVRFFTGYSGWSPGQLDGELEGGAWFVIDAEPADPLSSAPADLWTVALKRQDGAEAMRSQDSRRHWLN